MHKTLRVQSEGSNVKFTKTKEKKGKVGEKKEIGSLNNEQKTKERRYLKITQ